MQQLNEFIASNNLDPDARALAFAVFVVGSLINRHTQAGFRLSDVVCDGRNDTGIDGIAVVVDGRVIATAEELEQAAAAGGVARCEVVLIQATLATSFQSPKIGRFATGARDLLAEQPEEKANAHIDRWRAVMQVLRREVKNNRLPRPGLSAYYAAALRWQGQEPARSTLADLEAQLGEIPLIASASAKAVGVEEIGLLGKEFAKRSEHLVDSSDLHRLSGSLPDVVSYAGTVPAVDILRTITRQIGDKKVIDESFFSANARHYLGAKTQVNRGITKTIEGPNGAHFWILNLGLTIICRAVTPEDGSLRLIDSQIVNGSQTVHTLFNALQEVEDKQIRVFVRIQVATDPDFMRDIVISNNSQNQVFRADLIGLLPFNRNLEQYFDAMSFALNCETPYYACRRGVTYAENDEQEDASAPATGGRGDLRRIGLNELILAYLAVFCGKPERASHEYAALRDSAPDEVFNNEHEMEPYFSAGFALMLFRQALVADRVPRELQDYRAHFLHLLGSRIRKKIDIRQPGDQIYARSFAMEANQLLQQSAEVFAIFAADVELIRAAISQTPIFGERNDLRARSPEFLAVVERLATETE